MYAILPKTAHWLQDGYYKTLQAAGKEEKRILPVADYNWLFIGW